MSKSRKRKHSDSPEELERLIVCMKKMEEDLRAKESELQAKDNEIMSLRRERDCLYGEVDELHKTSLAELTVNVVQPKRGHVHDLPDKVLLRVFDLLDRTLLADVVCMVCRRWCDLVGEPSLWDRTTLAYGNSKGVRTGAEAFIRTLGAAPVLHALECGLSAADPSAVRFYLEHCNTAASHVCFDLDAAAPDAVLRVLWNSRRILKEFCLREGPLALSDFSYSQACRFWELLEDSPQLRTLVLFISQTSGLSSCLYSFRPSARPSLRTLCLDVGVVDEQSMLAQLGVVATTIATTLIMAHRATLEEVRLPMRGVCSPGAVKALSRCPLLRKARAPVSLEVHHLSRCEQLRELHLTADHMRRALNTDRLLHSICQLRQLHELTVQQLGRCSDAPAVACGLLGALDELTELRRLYLPYLPSCDALDRLTASPEAAPHLHILHLGMSCGDVPDGECRLPAFRRLLQMRRQLHVSLGSVKVRDEEPSCGSDHRGLAATSPALPVALVNHAQDAQPCVTCAGFVNQLSGTTLHVIQDGEFLEGDLLWRDASDLSVASTPARAEVAAVKLEVKQRVSDTEPESPETGRKTEYFGPPNKVRITTAAIPPVKPGKTKMPPKPRGKTPAKSSKSKTKARPPSKKAQRPSQRRLTALPALPAPPSAPSADSSVVEHTYAIPTCEGPLSRTFSESPRPSSEGDHLLKSPPSIEESVLLSKVPDMILPRAGDGSSDCLVTVILPAGPRTVSAPPSSSITAQACTSTSPVAPSAMPSSTVSSTMPPVRRDTLPSTDLETFLRDALMGSQSRPRASSSAQSNSKRKTQPKKSTSKKPAVSRKGKAIKAKISDAVKVTPLPLPPPAAATPSVLVTSLDCSPLVSSTLPCGFSRLPAYKPQDQDVDVNTDTGRQAEEKYVPSDDPADAQVGTPPCEPVRVEGIDYDPFAYNASPRRNQSRACRPVSLADADDRLDHFVSTTRKVAFQSAPKPRASKSLPAQRPAPKQIRKSAPAATFFSDLSNDPLASGASCDAPCEDSCDAHSETSSPSIPFIGFSPAADGGASVYVEVATDSIKVDGAPEYSLERMITAGSPGPRVRVLEVLRSARPDGQTDMVKVEGVDDALNNNSKTWCTQKVNTDPPWVQPVIAERVRSSTNNKPV